LMPGKPITLVIHEGWRDCVMDLRHLGLPVRDEWRSQQFYADYFGFDPATARECEDSTVISATPIAWTWRYTRLGMSSRRQRSCMPGSKPRSQLRVRALLERMEADGVTIVKRDDEAGYVAFRCLGPGRPPDRGGLGATALSMMRGLRAGISVSGWSCTCSQETPGGTRSIAGESLSSNSRSSSMGPG
jgi:hypothetical protein